uniref:Glycerophosphocholine acyltransferase 1 n=1 Tax=Odontella aurita TaxID=265563 RepID=A0A7S4JRP2_9STRA|mmetsp:Transcript_5252/g.15203  ORF Transcript_5252/g.15203 Transcript_5252/m.15203 type:complete len:1233 (+) Transcript_5252:303-4001(+)
MDSNSKDFPFFYRTMESMSIDEAIGISQRGFGEISAQRTADGTTFPGSSIPSRGMMERDAMTGEEFHKIQTMIEEVDRMVQAITEKLFDEMHFAYGVLNCLLITFVFGVYPQHFWLLYLIEMSYLIPRNQLERIRARPLNKAFYYVDYCWMMNFVALLALVALVSHSLLKMAGLCFMPEALRKHIFLAVLGTAGGPLLFATALLPHIALLFHDIDTMTGLFIHIFPPMISYTLRWRSDEIRQAWPNIFHLDYLDKIQFSSWSILGTVAGNALAIYAVWFITYLIWMLLIGIDLPRKDRKAAVGAKYFLEPKYDTCFHSFMRGGACIALGSMLWGRPRAVSLQQVETNHFERRDFIAHMTYHCICTLFSIFGLGYLCFEIKAAHASFLVLIISLAVRRGAKRYRYYSTQMYSQTLRKHFAVLQNSSFQEQRDEAENSVDDSCCLEYLLQSKVMPALGTRIGLVPNYFITRGESIPQNEARTLTGFCRMSLSRFLKIFYKWDFRDEESYREFDSLVHKLGLVHQNGNGAVKVAATDVINRPLYRNGETILHALIKRRQLKFVKSLLLHSDGMLNINQINKRGQSALDYAFDRLEVEIVFLLRLYGAEDSHGNVPNSLGYFEWLCTDMIANLDTGRWLHRRSVTAIMSHVMSSPLPQQELLDWALDECGSACLDDSTLKLLSKLPHLFAITLADGCDAVTNHEAWATLIRYLLSARRHASTTHDENESSDPLHGDSVDPSNAIDFPTQVLCEDISQLLNDKGADQATMRVAGRTLFFTLRRDNTRDVALKLSKSFEETKHPHPLAKEADMNNRMEHLKPMFGLQSEYPSGSQLLTITNLPNAMRLAVETQQAKGYHPFALSNELARGITALLYYPPKGYGQYVNDPCLSMDDCRSGILKAAHDYAVLARNGLFHGALVDIQHDSVREQRPHVWSFESFLTRFRGGAGRIDRGFAGLSAPNVRVSGLGDLKHIINCKQVQARYDPSVIHAQHNILYDDQERFQVCLLEQLGAGLFATSLLIASCWEGRSRAGVSESSNIDLAETLSEGFSTFLSGYLGVSLERAESLLRLMHTDFPLMARQVKMFASAWYVQVAESAPRRPIFGAVAKFTGALSHPTAFVHFSQRSGRNLQQEGYSLGGIAAVYQSSHDGTMEAGGLPEGYPRVDTSMMRCSPTWVRGHGWVNSEGAAHFGSYEGALPFQQLIRDLYTVTYLAAMIRASATSLLILAVTFLRITFL